MNTSFTQTAPADERQLKSDEMDQILSAILSGKYSWACALILRYTGHEPLNYLPQRTYTRIMRENWYSPNHNHKSQPTASTNPYPNWPASQASHLLRDLDHHDRADNIEQVQGGSSHPWFDHRRNAAQTGSKKYQVKPEWPQATGESKYYVYIG